MKTARILISTAAALTVSLAASAKLVDAGDVDIRFQATGTAGMRIKGEGTTLTASEKDGKLKIVAPLTNLKTGIALRDRHLRKYLETDKYPDATLEVDRKKLNLPGNDKEVEASATGDFTLHGVTKPVKFSYKANRTGSDYHVQALATINITDFKIEQPCYLRVCVDEDVKLKVKFKLRDK
jgi:polyisoprenoid-binding protein YceI